MRFPDRDSESEPIARANGCAVVKTFTGHGVNDLFHCPPNVPHYAKNKAVGTMKPGMVKPHPLKSFVILMANTFPAPGVHHRTRAFQSGYGHPRLTVGLTLDRCSTWERTGKRSTGLTIGPPPQSTANAVLSSKRLYCPSSPASPYCSNLHARITETGVEVLTAGKPREDLR